MNYSEIMSQILEAFESSGLSYSDLSRMTGIPKSMIPRYLTGSVESVPLERLDAICEALGLSLPELLGWRNRNTGSEKVLRSMTPQQAVLFDKTRDLTEKEQDAIMAVIDALKSTRRE